MSNVIHDKYGKGTAYKIYLDNFGYTRIAVKFVDKSRGFHYPDIFILKHMEATDALLAEKVKNDIQAYYDEIDKPWKQKPKMFAGFQFEYNGYDVYNRCCDVFGFDKSKNTSFKRHSIMYARNATPEGYSVWFPVHNNLWEDFNDEHKWYNYIFDDVIEEVWLFDGGSLLNDMSERVTFVRNKEGYCFYGIYRPVGVDIKEVHGCLRQVKRYERISTRYPK